MPKLIIIGGPNGCGKTTLALKYSAMSGLKYLGADSIAEQLSPGSPAAVAIKAARLFSAQLDESLGQEESLIVESTLSGLSLRRPIQTALDRGYHVTVLFIFLGMPETCVARVKERVANGGHDVPEVDIERRFTRSLRNFWSVYRLMATEWTLLYNGGQSAVRVASSEEGGMFVADERALRNFLRLAGE
jgi:predicted ABC-type ATPase